MSKMYFHFVNTLRQLTRREEGASLAEYGLLLALIAVACLAALEALGGALSGLFEQITGSL